MNTPLDHDADPKRRANAWIGERVHTLMWRAGRTQKQLAQVLNIDQGSVSNRLRGKTAWTVIDLLAVATWLDVPVADLMPEIELLPDDEDDDDSPNSAPTRTRTWDLRIKRPKVGRVSCGKTPNYNLKGNHCA